MAIPEQILRTLADIADIDDRSGADIDWEARYVSAMGVAGRVWGHASKYRRARETVCMRCADLYRAALEKRERLPRLHKAVGHTGLCQEHTD
ncbi:MAG: hypothetical protein OXN18_01970 [Gemmatimonadota bacterium]|nr:hypothetical protein [Gemmatimonadota bacterium]